MFQLHQHERTHGVGHHYKRFIHLSTPLAHLICLNLIFPFPSWFYELIFTTHTPFLYLFSPVLPASPLHCHPLLTSLRLTGTVYTSQSSFLPNVNSLLQPFLHPNIFPRSVLPNNRKLFFPQNIRTYISHPSIHPAIMTILSNQHIPKCQCLV